MTNTINFEEMSLDELKKYAKEKGMIVGNISKEKLVAKLTEFEKANSVLSEDSDIIPDESVEEITPVANEPINTLDAITNAIDEVAEDSDIIETVEELPSDTIVRVRSMTFGKLIYKSAVNGAEFVWGNIGSIQDMTIGEITSMNNAYPDYLHKPLVILLDERAVRQFRLSRIYENVAKISDLKTLFTRDNATIEKTIDEALEVNMRDMLISKVRTMYKNGTLKDINIIRMLENKLKFDILGIN